MNGQDWKKMMVKYGMVDRKTVVKICAHPVMWTTNHIGYFWSTRGTAECEFLTKKTAPGYFLSIQVKRHGFENRIEQRDHGITKI